MASPENVQNVLVTGANQGLGFAIVAVAATRNPSARYLLACRSLERGQEAIANLKEQGVTASLEPLQLDVTKDTDITKAVESIKNSYGKLDVLVNNAGIFKPPIDDSLSTLRTSYSDMFAVNVTSVACMCAAFQPLLAKSTHPKVINITSGLGSIANSLTKPMHRSPPYGTTKVAVNGLTAHLQTGENDRKRVDKDEDRPMIKYYAVAPGFLKTAFTRFNEHGKDPIAGAEVVVQLINDDHYPGGTQWEYEEGQMRQVPW